MDDNIKERENQASKTSESEKIFDVKVEAPEQMKSIARWVLHRGKVPYAYGGKKKELFKVNPAKEGVKLLTFEEAVKGLTRYEADGLGFALDRTKSQLVCIDLDGIENPYIGRLSVELKDTYVELSPSGEGFHIWYVDKELEGISGRRIKDLEIYAGKRFITFTGKKLEMSPCELREHNGLTRRLLWELFDNADADKELPEADFEKEGKHSDAELEAAIERSQDALLRRLLKEGDTSGYQSASEADWHCVLKLCFWTGGNAGQIERLITSSELGRREKWTERIDYRRRTIRRALAVWDGVEYGGKASTEKKGIEIRQGEKSLLVDAQSGKPIVFETPRGYKVDERGIRKVGEEEDEYKVICSDVILPLRTYCNADTKKVSVELWYKRQGRWAQTVVENREISSIKTIVELSELGLDVTSINAREMVTFFRAFKASNVKQIEEVTSYGQTGWRSDGEFIYPAENERYVIDVGREINLISLFQGSGDRDRWLSVYNELKKYKYFRLAVAASLAAPLLKKLHMRNMTLEFWSQSGEGKTAILKFADSVYKNPIPLLKFDATASYIEARCVAMSDLPICIDELKTADRDRKSRANVDILAHFIESGSSRGRATKEVVQRTIRTFRTIALLTGEKPLTDAVSDMGIKRRTLELYCREIFPKDVTVKGRAIASYVHEFVSENYGLIGQEWIEYISRRHVEEEIVDRYWEYQRRLTEKRPDAFVDHCNLLAACAVADYYFNLEIADEGTEPETEIILNIAEKLTAEASGKEVNRAFEYVADWLSQNMGYFVDVEMNEGMRAIKYGWIVEKGKPEESILVIPSVLKDALKQQGFSAKKVLTELAEEGLIETQLQKGREKVYYSITQRIKGEGSKRVVKIRRDTIRNFVENLNAE